jgi:hypothetical protein
MLSKVVLLAAALCCMAVHVWCEKRCTTLDVANGRRDPGALVDDYGSDRGWYPRWKMPSLLAFIAAGGLLLAVLS